MKTLGDILEGARETYGIFQPFVEEESAVDLDMHVYHAEPGAFQNEKEAWERIDENNILGVLGINKTSVRPIDEIQKVLAETFAFDGKRIKRLSLAKEHGDKSILYVTFDGGLHIRATSDPCEYLMKKEFVIAGLQPALHFTYEVTPTRLFTEFKLNPDQIPEGRFYSTMAEKLQPLSKFEGTIADYGSLVDNVTADQINQDLSQRVHAFLLEHYRVIQKDLVRGKEGAGDWFGIQMKHKPTEEPSISCSIYYNPFISAMKSRSLLNTPIFDITRKFDELELAVKSLYTPFFVAEIEKHALKE